MTYENLKKVEDILDNGEEHEIEEATKNRLQVLRERIEKRNSRENVETALENMSNEINNIEKALNPELFKHVIESKGLDGIKELIFLLTNKSVSKVNQGLTLLRSYLPEGANTQMFTNDISKVRSNLVDNNAILYAWQIYRQEIFGRVLDVYGTIKKGDIPNIQRDEELRSQLVENHMSSWKENKSQKTLESQYGTMKGIRSYHALVSATHDLTCRYTKEEVEVKKQENPNVDWDGLNQKGFLSNRSTRMRLASSMDDAKNVKGSLEEVSAMLGNNVNLQKMSMFVMLGNGMTRFVETSAFRLQNVIYDKETNRYWGMMANGCGTEGASGNLVMLVPEGLSVANYGSKMINAREKQENDKLNEAITVLTDKKTTIQTELDKVKQEKIKAEQEYQNAESTLTTITEAEKNKTQLTEELTKLKTQPSYKLKESYEKELADLDDKATKHSKKWNQEKITKEKESIKTKYNKKVSQGELPLTDLLQQIQQKETSLSKEQKIVDETKPRQAELEQKKLEKEQEIKTTDEKITQVNKELSDIELELTDKNSQRMLNKEEVIQKVEHKNDNVQYDPSNNQFSITNQSGKEETLPVEELVTDDADINKDMIDNDGKLSNLTQGKAEEEKKTQTAESKDKGEKNNSKLDSSDIVKTVDTPKPEKPNPSNISDNNKNTSDNNGSIFTDKVSSTQNAVNNTLDQNNANSNSGKTSTSLTETNTTDLANQSNTSEKVDNPTNNQTETKATTAQPSKANNETDTKVDNTKKSEQVDSNKDNNVSKESIEVKTTDDIINQVFGSDVNPEVSTQMKQEISKVAGREQQLIDSYNITNGKESVRTYLTQLKEQVDKRLDAQKKHDEEKSKNIEKEGSTLGQLTFKTDSSELNPDQEVIMGQLSERIKKFIDDNPDGRLQIVGHTSRQGANLEKLSLERANTIKKELMKKYSIDGTKVSILGKGGKEPLYGAMVIDDNAPVDRRNQRIEVFAYKGDGTKADLMQTEIDVIFVPPTTEPKVDIEIPKTTDQNFAGDFSTEDYTNLLKNDPTYTEEFGPIKSIELVDGNEYKIKLDSNEAGVVLEFSDLAAWDQDYFMVTLDGVPLIPENGKTSSKTTSGIRQKYGWTGEPSDYTREQEGMFIHKRVEYKDELRLFNEYANSNIIKLDASKQKQTIKIYTLSSGTVLPNTVDVRIKRISNDEILLPTVKYDRGEMKHYNPNGIFPIYVKASYNKETGNLTLKGTTILIEK